MAEVFRELDPLIDRIAKGKKSINPAALEAGARIHQAMENFIPGLKGEILDRTIHLGRKEFGRMVLEFHRIRLGHETPYFVYFYKKVDPHAPIPRKLIIIDCGVVRHFEASYDEQFSYTHNLSGTETMKFLQDLPKGPDDAFFSPPTQPVL